MPFSTLIGQPKAVELLSRALQSNRLAHGYLFLGPEGVGKATAARALAARLLCRTTEDTSSCGHCSDCIKFSSGNHPDFLAVRPDGAGIKINQIRELKRSLSFPPFAGDLRVVILEDVQTMGREAGNSLLKILEEPPPDNLLLLVAADSEPLLETILSRCQVIPFVPLNMEQTAEVIRRNHPDFSPEEVRSLAELTGGCPGLADTLHNDEVLQLHKECIRALLQETRTQAQAVEEALYLAGQMAELKDGLHQFLDLLALYFKEIMISVLCTKEQIGADSAADSAAYPAARERWSLQQLSAMVDAVDAARRELARNCNRALVCEVLLLELFCG
ncbi:MAG: DNA polymerase III subunit delta' [Candidatus Electrothrix sp. YB6]